MKPTFDYVEDYMEFIGGWRDASGKLRGLFDTVPVPISLARYDVKVVESLAEQTGFSNNAYTDRQAKLAASLVDKYRKQLSKLTPAIIVPDELDKFRLGIRQMDRTKSISLKDGVLHLKFPYDTKLIEVVRIHGKKGSGSAEFDYDAKVWKLGLTEYHVNWVMAVAETYGFTVSDEVKELYNKILEAEKSEYTIELMEQDGKFVITNAADSLNEYIEQNLGGFGLENALTLIDNASVLGYAVPAWLTSELADVYGAKAKMLTERHHEFKRGTTTLEEVVEYARMVNRLPVYVYSHGLPKNDTEDIKYLNRNIDPDIKTKVLVTTTNMMIGSRKQAWLSNAEKIFLLE
jgi:uncharacterized protein YgfB (UPF0149 family)